MTDGPVGHVTVARTIAESWVQYQVVQGIAMSSSNELNTPFGNGAGCRCLLLGAYLVNDYDFGHMVFHCLNHYCVLLTGSDHLHPSGVTDGPVGHVTVARDFVGGIDDYDPLFAFIGQHPGHLTQHGSFADTRSSQ